MDGYIYSGEPSDYPLNSIVPENPYKFNKRGGINPLSRGNWETAEKSLRTRNKNIRVKMETFFRETVLPVIAERLNPLDWKDLAGAFQDDSFYVRGGYVKWTLGDRWQWIHPELEPELTKRARDAGATIQP